MLASGAGLGQSLLFHLLGCVAGRVPLGNSLPARGVVGRVALVNRLPVCCVVGRLLLVNSIPVCRTVGRLALSDLLPIHYPVHRPVALSTAVALLSGAGFKGFPAMRATPAHLRPPFFGSRAWKPEAATAGVHNGMTAIPITGRSIGAAWRPCQSIFGASRGSR